MALICYDLKSARSKSISKLPRLNDAIQAPQLRVITDDGKQLGVLTRAEAISAAEEAGLDLVEVSPDAKPPVVKMVNWGKYNYQRTKQLQKNRKSSKQLDLKQIRMGLKIGEHDLGVKIKKINAFLEAGHKVRVTIVYRGRELAHKEIGFTLADKVQQMLGDTVIADQPPQLTGKQLNFVIRSNNAKVKTT